MWKWLQQPSLFDFRKMMKEMLPLTVLMYSRYKHHCEQCKKLIGAVLTNSTMHLK